MQKKTISRGKTKNKPVVKALVLLSGGLDSRLVCRLLEEQLGKDSVEAVFFALPFGGGCCSDRFCVFKFAQQEGIKLHIIDCTKGVLFQKYMAMIMKPRFQRGTAMNPCIDCHLFMLKEAKKLAMKIGVSFLATGEVLGERPLSQRREVMLLIEKEAGLSGKVLRPLSAKLLPETEAERKGWVDRDKLLGICGRRRVEQLALAKKYGMDFPSPAGGCLLTDTEFSKRLIGLIAKGKAFSFERIELARLGRHFRLGKTVIIVGRNHQENIMIKALAESMDLPTLEANVFMGPTTVLTAKRPAKTLLKAAAMLTARYSDAPKCRKCRILVKSGKKVSKISVIAPVDNAFFEKTAVKQSIIN